MNRRLRTPRRTLIAVATIALALVASLATPAAAGFGEVLPDDLPTRTAANVRRAMTNVLDASMDLPDITASVKLDCDSRVTDAGAAAVCEWRAPDDLDVRAWQLWNLQVRPVHGSRNLVAQVGADVRSFTDRDVEVPAVYLYAVLGLDNNGEIIARSRIDSVKFLERDIAIEPMRLECAAHRTPAATDVVVDHAPRFAVGCKWNEVSNDAAVGYVLWKSVDGGERHAIARVGLETTSVRDGDVLAGHRYTYVVTAVDGAGEVVGRSRGETVGIRAHDGEIDRPVDRPVERPIERDSVERDSVERVPTDRGQRDGRD